MRTLRLIIVSILLALASCKQSITIKTNNTLSVYNKDLAVRLIACDFIAKPAKNGTYLIKWNCPWIE